MRGGLRCAKMMNGERSAMMDGAPLMLKWPADNSDMEQEVHIHLYFLTPHYYNDMRHYN